MPVLPQIKIIRSRDYGVNGYFSHAVIKFIEIKLKSFFFFNLLTIEGHH